MKHTCYLALASMLSACATKPLPHVQIQYVDRPVAVACIDHKDVPAEPAPIGQIPGDARQAADLLGAKLSDTRATIHELMALIQPCVRTP